MKSVYGALLASISIIAAAGTLSAATFYQYTYTPGDLTRVTSNPGEEGESTGDLDPPIPGLSFSLEFTTDGTNETPFAGLELVLDSDGFIAIPDLPEVYLFADAGFSFAGFVRFDDDQNIIAWSFTNFDAEPADGCGAFGQTVAGETTGTDFCTDNNLLTYSFGTTPGGWTMFSEFIGDAGGGINPNPGDLGGGGGLPGPVPLPPSPVPLPASVLLLFSGLGALGAGGLWRRRRALG